MKYDPLDPIISAYAPLESRLVDLVTMAANAVSRLEKSDDADDVRFAKALMATAMEADNQRAKVIMRISMISEPRNPVTVSCQTCNGHGYGDFGNRGWVGNAEGGLVCNDCGGNGHTHQPEPS